MYFQWPPNKIQKASSATTRRQAADTRCVPKTRDLRRASPNMITVRNLARGAKCWHVPPDHQLILRGCASKRKMFHVECESHMSGIRWVYSSSNIFFNYFLHFAGRSSFATAAMTSATQSPELAPAPAFYLAYSYSAWSHDTYYSSCGAVKILLNIFTFVPVFINGWIVENG